MNRKELKRNQFFFADGLREWLFGYLEPIQPDVRRLIQYGGLHPLSDECVVRIALEFEGFEFRFEVEPKFDPTNTNSGFIRLYLLLPKQEERLLFEHKVLVLSSISSVEDRNNSIQALGVFVSSAITLSRILTLMKNSVEEESDRYEENLRKRDEKILDFEAIRGYVAKDLRQMQSKGYLSVSPEVLEFFKLRSSQLRLLEKEASKKIENWPVPLDGSKLEQNKLDSWSNDVAREVWNSCHPEFEKLVHEYTREEYVPQPNSVMWALVSFVAILIPPLLLISLPMYFSKKKQEAQSHIVGISPTQLLDLRTEVTSEMRSLARHFLSTAAEIKVSSLRNLRLEELSMLVGNRWQPLAAPPTIDFAALNPEEAEHACRDYLLFLGATGARVTRFSRDGGVDVESDLYVVQVKHQEGPVGVKVVREIAGVASLQDKTPIVFAKRSYTEEAKKFAEAGSILLFTYLPSLRADSSEARRALEVGLSENFN